MRKTARSRKTLRTSGVELLRRVEVAAERLLDDDPVGLPTARHQPALAQVADDGDEVLRRGGAVEEPVAAGVALALDAVDLLLQGLERCRRVEVAADVADAVFEALPDVLVGLAGARVLVDRLAHLLAELLVRQRPPRHADDREVRRQEALEGEVVEGGHQLLPGQVAGGPEDHHHRGCGRALLAEALPERVDGGLLLARRHQPPVMLRCRPRWSPCGHRTGCAGRRSPWPSRSRPGAMRSASAARA